MAEYRFRRVHGDSPLEQYVQSLGGNLSQYIIGLGGSPEHAGLGCGWIGDKTASFEESNRHGLDHISGNSHGGYVANSDNESLD